VSDVVVKKFTFAISSPDEFLYQAKSPASKDDIQLGLVLSASDSIIG